MRNQTSFRLTTTLLPTDTTAKTTTVINKVDSNGDKFYPTFTEETVVLTNDDRTIMETTRATCNNWVLTFVKRGLSDDVTGTPRDNRKLTWNPWTLAFITAWASDWIDKDDDITWTGDQTYTGNLVSTGSATYRWELTTEKWVKYPHFDNVSDLEACTWAFGGMFAVVDSSWELYRYNAVTEEWSLIESSTPANPEMADDETIWTVRIATDAEFEAWTDTGSRGEYLVATPSQIKGIVPTMALNVINLDISNTLSTQSSVSVSYTTTRSGRILLEYEDVVYDWESRATLDTTGSTATVLLPETIVNYRSWSAAVSGVLIFDRKILVPVGTGSVKFNLVKRLSNGYDQFIKIKNFFYYW